MKLQIISDIHQELGFCELPFDKADIVILAGDINIGIKGVQWALEKFPKTHVIYILGNHEYYKGSYPKTLRKIKDLASNTNIHVLENESIEINEVMFHGATLWTDFSLFGDPIQYGVICQGKMNDYKRIRKDPSYSKLISVDTYRLHMFSRGWLEKSLQASKSEKNIVVTHHAPSIKSVPNEFRKDPITAAYASNLEGTILSLKPQYWIHGHIHSPVRYQIGETEVICNPHGYIDEKYNGYEKELIIEI